MADQTPSWLTENEGASASAAPTSDPPPAAAAAAPEPIEQSTATATATAAAPAAASASRSAAASSAAAPAADEEDLPKMIFLMRLMNMALAITMIACSIVTMISLGTNPAAWVLAIYATCGGLLICCLETQLKFLRTIIAMNFGFLFNFFWRFLFYLLMGSVAWSYDSLFGKIVACAFFGVALFNTFVLCRYPSYRRMREKIAEEEDKRIEAKISGEVKKKALKSMFTK